MKKLETLSLTRLSQLEFGQHTKSIYTDITDRGASEPIHDTVLNGYLTELNLKNLAYDKAMVQIIKSDETAKIAHADDLRDRALISLQRYLSVFEFSTDAALLDSYASLNTLFSHYKKMQTWNFEEETNGIDNLVADLQSDRYSNSVDLIGMLEFVLALKTSNETFKTLFSGRTHEQASKEVFDVKQLRSDLKTTYEKTVNYVLAMAIATDNAEFNDILSIVNTVRKYYSDLIARRKPAEKTPAPSAN